MTDSVPLSNAEIADRLAGLAQLLSTQKENLYKVRAYQRAATQIRNIPDSIQALVRSGADLSAEGLAQQLAMLGGVSDDDVALLVVDVTG